MTRTIMQMQRTIALARMDINYQIDCMYKIVIEDQPSNLSMFAREVSYGKGTIESDAINIRTGDINIPMKKTAGEITVVFNDDEDGTVSSFITTLQGRIFNSDGTQNLPSDYLFYLQIYRLDDTGEYRLDGEWDVYVEENSDYSCNNDSRNELGTFNVTFKKYRSIGD